MTSFAFRLFQIAAFAIGFAAMSTTASADAGHAPGIGEPAKASEATRTIQIKLEDNSYSPEIVQVKAGETVRFVLTNSGELLHEFNIGTAAMHAKHREEMLAMMESGMLTPTGLETDMSKMDHSKMGGHSMTHDDPNSVLVGPGETKELVWKFSGATELQFACNIPGHYESGMVGEFHAAR